MTVLGVDLSTRNIDLVLLDEDDPTQATHHRIKLNQPWWESARNMRDILASRGNLRRPFRYTAAAPAPRGHLAGVERPYGPNRQAIASLHTILGAFLASLPSWITPVEIRPADMRRELGLKQNCPKETMHGAIAARHTGTANTEYFNWPPDAFDAWAAGHAALRMCERNVKQDAA